MKKNKRKILIIEDEKAMVNVLKDNLEYEGYDVEEAYDGEQGLKKAKEEGIDLIILDIMLPEKNGFEVCKELRGSGALVPVLFLTAKGGEVDRVLGLEMGGDDYLCKPFSIRELLARVKAILRRSDRHWEGAEWYRIGKVDINFKRFLTKDKRGKEEPLSHYEIAILKMFLQEKNTPIPRNRILDEIWGIEAFPTDRTVDNYIVKLRKKIEPDPKNPRHIITVHGVGYKFVE